LDSEYLIMKICPQCQTTYTDDTLRFCLHDGVPLNNFGASSNINASSGPETIIRDPATWRPNAPAVPEKKSRKALAIFAAVIVTFFILGIGIVSAFMIFLSAKRAGLKNEIKVSVNKSAMIPTNSNAASNANSAINTNLNTATNANSASNSNAFNSNVATPVPKPTLEPAQVEEIRSEISELIHDWTAAAEDLDVDSHVSYYGPIVDYFRGGKMSIAKVRADKEKAFAKFDTVSVDIGEIEITPDATGNRATAIFDKEWTFQKDENTSTGKVRSQLVLDKTSGEWKIVSEKDLKVYRVGN